MRVARSTCRIRRFDATQYYFYSNRTRPPSFRTVERVLSLFFLLINFFFSRRSRSKTEHARRVVVVTTTIRHTIDGREPSRAPVIVTAGSREKVRAAGIRKSKRNLTYPSSLSLLSRIVTRCVFAIFQKRKTNVSDSIHNSSGIAIV